MRISHRQSTRPSRRPAAELGLEIVSVTTFTDDTTDFSVQVTEAREAGADLVFLPIYYTPASMILQQANSMDYAPVFFGVDGMDGILNIEGFDTSLAEGVMLLTPFSADATDELTGQLRHQVRRSLRRDPGSVRRGRLRLRLHAVRGHQPGRHHRRHVR